MFTGWRNVFSLINNELFLLKISKLGKAIKTIRCYDFINKNTFCYENKCQNEFYTLTFFL